MVLLSEQVRGSIPMTTLGHVNAATPRAFDLDVICSTWMALVGFTLHFMVERSLDGGATWTAFGEVTLTTQSVGKNGAPATRWRVGWDGLEMDVRASVDVVPAPFPWGLQTL